MGRRLFATGGMSPAQGPRSQGKRNSLETANFQSGMQQLLVLSPHLFGLTQQTGIVVILGGVLIDRTLIDQQHPNPLKAVLGLADLSDALVGPAVSRGLPAL